MLWIINSIDDLISKIDKGIDEYLENRNQDTQRE
jgi:hypothetical protein